MKGTKIIIVAAAIAIATIYVLWKEGSFDPNKTRINEGVYLVRENGAYSIYCVKRTRGLIRYYDEQKLIACDIDSIVISDRYGTVFHGRSNSTNNFEWFYIDVSDVKNVHEGFENFKDATSSTIGESYIDSVMTPDETWAIYQ